VAGTGGNGNASNQLKNPWDLAVDYSNTLYVTDRYNHRVQKFLTGSVIGITVAGQASGIFGTTLSDLSEPTGIQVDSSGNIYVADKNHDRILFWPNGSPSGQIIAGNGKTE
jgi:sugar lactone lactonase YvrE